jgi:hypothetical protein
VATPAGHQSSNGLVELHWKTMVHMSWAYLTEKQMPWSFWFYLVVHSAQMMIAIPGKLHSKLASPFLLVYSVDHNKRTWFPLFFVVIFIMKKTGRGTFTLPSSHNRWHCHWSLPHIQCAIGLQSTDKEILIA